MPTGGVYCQQAGWQDSSERIYELEVQVEEQRQQISDLEQKVFQIGGETPAPSGQIIMIQGSGMTPEMTELFAAFEARVASLEQKMAAVEKAIGSVQVFVARIMKKLGIR
jgi:uncharacterized coiled-coil protein SlyX